MTSYGGPDSRNGNGIDVVIPAIEKDLGTLPYVIDGIRTKVKHRIGRIYVVSPPSLRIKRLCRKKSCTFVNEKKVLPIGKKNIVYRSKKWERSGWLYQQLLKLGSSRIVRKRHYLVMDADTVLVSPHRFRIGAKTVFYCRGWSQPEYYRTYRKLVGRKAPSPRSFVAHYMLFDKIKLGRLKRRIEARHGKPWYRAILSSIDRTKQYGFSEFETYGNFLYAENPRQTLLRSARNKSLRGSPARLSPAAIRRYARKYRSISFHKRKGYVRKG